MEKDTIALNDYYKQQSLRLARELSEQPLMSFEAFTKQVKRIALKASDVSIERRPIVKKIEKAVGSTVKEKRCPPKESQSAWRPGASNLNMPDRSRLA